MNDRELKTFMQWVAEGIQERLPDRNTFFALLICDDHSEMQYISNGNREDVVRAMRECADRLEKHQDKPRVK